MSSMNYSKKEIKLKREKIFALFRAIAIILFMVTFAYGINRITNGWIAFDNQRIQILIWTMLYITLGLPWLFGVIPPIQRKYMNDLEDEIEKLNCEIDYMSLPEEKKW